MAVKERINELNDYQLKRVLSWWMEHSTTECAICKRCIECEHERIDEGTDTCNSLRLEMALKEIRDSLHPSELPRWGVV